MARQSHLKLFAACLIWLTAGCVLGVDKYESPPRTYPTLFTYEQGFDAVWEGAHAALLDMGFTISSADKATGKIETAWSDTGLAPARECVYGFFTYVENPKRRERLSVVVKSLEATQSSPAFSAPPPVTGGFPSAPPPPAAPASPAPAFPGAAPAPAAAPFPGAAPVAPAPAPAPGGGGDVMSGSGGGVTGGRTMMIVVSKGQSVLDQECGDAPASVEIQTDTATEYRLIHRVGQSLGQTLDPPPQG